MSETIERIVVLGSKVGVTKHLGLVLSARLAYLRAELKITRVDGARPGLTLLENKPPSTKFAILLVGMELEHGDEIVVRATGEEAELAVGEVEHMFSHVQPVPYSHLCAFGEGGPRGHGPAFAGREIIEGLGRLNMMLRGG